jgi:hypothetical protein
MSTLDSLQNERNYQPPVYEWEKCRQLAHRVNPAVIRLVFNLVCIIDLRNCRTPGLRLCAVEIVQSEL